MQPNGEYMKLKVRDISTGTDEETQAQICKPFYTRKDEGGAGAFGRATIYGIIKQCGGFIAVDSEPGCGTISISSFPVQLECLNNL